LVTGFNKSALEWFAMVNGRHTERHEFQLPNGGGRNGGVAREQLLRDLRRM